MSRNGVADPKPLKRVRDSHALSEFYDHNHQCLACGWRYVEAHHVLFRSQGGDDTRANLVPLCSSCHQAAHGTVVRGGQGREVTPEIVRYQIAQFLRGEDGADHCAYLIAKLGPWAAEAFVQKLEGSAPPKYECPKCLRLHEARGVCWRCRL